MPMIRELVLRIFGREPYTSIDPEKAIAFGASIQAAFKSRADALKEVVMTDVCPFSLGINVARSVGKRGFIFGQFLPIIDRNTTIPVSRVQSLHPLLEDQTKVVIGVYQGESRLVENNILLNEIEIEVPKKKDGEQIVDVRFTYDVNGLLEVEAFAHGTGETKRIIIEENPGVLSKSDIEEKFKKLQHLKIHPREKALNRAAISRGDRLFQELLGTDREQLAGAIALFEAKLETQDEAIIEEARWKLVRYLDSIEDGRIVL